MNEQEEEFFKKLKSTFLIEAEEHLQALSNHLLALEKNDLSSEQRKEKIETIFREAHSLKGAARAVNQQALQGACQSLENVLSAWKQNQIQSSPALFDTLYATIDGMSQSLTIGTQNFSKMIERLEAFVAIPTLLNPSEPFSSPTIPAVDLKPPVANEELIPPTITPSTTAPLATLVEEHETHQKSIEKGTKTVRIALSKLEQLFHEIEELLVIKLNLQQEFTDLKDLLNQYDGLEKERGKFLTEVQWMQAPLQETELAKKCVNFLDQQKQKMKGFREHLNQVCKTSEQNAHVTKSMVDTLLEDVKKILMQPAETLFHVMSRMARDIARDLGKNVQFVLQGGEIEVDRRILEEMKDPLIHLIRNAIDHGIELPEERQSKNKPTWGTLSVLVSESGGNRVELVIMDDGRGMNVNKLKEMAVQQKLLSQKEASEISNEEAFKIAFQSGVSTSSIITDLSGRGLGLGIVSEKVDKLGGHISVESIPNQGTKFKMMLPLTLVTFRGIHIAVANQEFMMPAHHVQRVLKVEQTEVKTVENRETIVFEDHSLSFIHLADLLGLAKDKVEPNSPVSLYALIVKAEEKTIAFGADYIYREREVLVKGLGKLCLRVKHVMAATIMEGGKIIPILNPSDLIKASVKENMHKTHVKEAKKNIAKKKRILLAEDSITTRLLIKNILESAGYDVKTAVDGSEAYELLQIETVDLLITDVEMPQMTGFVLTQKVRNTPTLKDLPIIICTSRGSREDREKGISLGANGYIDKNKFNQQSLVNIVEKLL
jgi:two-component system chemotaxis sensor kinase CheA